MRSVAASLTLFVALAVAAPAAFNASSIAARDDCSSFPSSPDMNMAATIRKVLCQYGYDLDSVAAKAAYVTAATETNCNNLDCGEGQAYGLFQQTPSVGVWGTKDQIMDPTHATEAFLGQMPSCLKQSQRPCTVAQCIQSSAANAYCENIDAGQNLLNKVIATYGMCGGGGSGNGASNVEGAPPPPPPQGKTSSGGGSSSSTSSSTCKSTHTVVRGDTCFGIEKKTGVSSSNLHAWNKSINSGCTNLQIGQKLCVSKSSASSGSTSKTSSSSSSGMCKKSETAPSGTNCSKMAAKYGISVSDFMKWNKQINGQCTNMQAGAKYCVSE